MKIMKRPDFLEYFTDATGKTHVLNVFCKCCGEIIQSGTMMRNPTGVTVPALRPTDKYVDMYIAYEDERGTLRRKSTPMCSDCASGEFSKDDLEAINNADTDIMVKQHRHSGVKDENVENRLEARKNMRMNCKIGMCIPGYAIVGEGR